MNKWYTVLDYEVEKEHNSYSDAVSWAQGTHCTDDRPRKEGGPGCYRLKRTTIVRKELWDKWQKDNQA